MDSEYPFSAVDLDDALLWPHTRLDSEIRSRENMLKRIKEKQTLLAEAESIIRDGLGALVGIAARRVMCVLSEYPVARDTALTDESIIKTLEATNGNRTRTARLQGVTESYIRKRIARMRANGIEIKPSPYNQKKAEPGKLRAVK